MKIALGAVLIIVAAIGYNAALARAMGMGRRQAVIYGAGVGMGSIVLIGIFAAGAYLLSDGHL